MVGGRTGSPEGTVQSARGGGGGSNGRFWAPTVRGESDGWRERETRGEKSRQESQGTEPRGPHGSHHRSWIKLDYED